MTRPRPSLPVGDPFADAVVQALGANDSPPPPARPTRRVRLRIALCTLVCMLCTITAVVPASASIQPTTTVTSYETPCRYVARTSRGIPALSYYETRGLIAWTRQHLSGREPDAVLADYWRALDACPAVAPFDWDSMVVANREVIR